MVDQDPSMAQAASDAPAPAEPSQPSLPSQHLTLTFPAEFNLETLKPVISSLVSGDQATEEQLAHPDGLFITKLYNALVNQWPTLTSASSELTTARAQAQEREAQVDSLLSDSESARQDALTRARDAEDQSRALSERNNALQLELNAAQEGLRAEQGTLLARNETLEQLEREVRESHADKRHMTAMLSKAKDASAEWETKYMELEREHAQLRTTHHQLTTELAAARSSEQQHKYRVQSIEQQLQLATHQAEWAQTELDRVSQAAATYRSTKGSEVLRLQTQLDSTEQSLTSIQNKLRFESSARAAAEERESQAQATIEDLSRRLATQEATFSSESAAANKRLEYLQRISNDAAERETGLEEAWQASIRESGQREGILQGEINQALARVAEIELEKQDLQEAMDRLASAMGIETDLANRPVDGEADDTSIVEGSEAGSVASRTHLSHLTSAPNSTLNVLSPSATVARRIRDSGKSFSEVYTDLVRTQEELRRERLEVTRLNQVLESVFEDLREKEPALEAQRQETEELRLDLQETSAALATLSSSSDQVAKERDELRLDRDRLKSEVGMVSQQLEDLGRQVRLLTREIVVRDDPTAADRLDDDGTLLPVPGTAEEEGTQAIITSELVTFSSLTGLVAQNQRLLRVVRDLASRVESREVRLQNTEEDVLAEAAENVEQLSERLQELEDQLESITHERDLFRDLVQSRESRHAPALNPDTTITSQPGGRSEEGLAALQTHFAEFKAEAKRDYMALRQEVADAQAQAQAKAIEAGREQTLREGLQSRLRTLESTAEQQRGRLDELNSSNASLQSRVVERDADVRRKDSEVLELRASLETIQREANHLRSEVGTLRSSETRLVTENQSLVAERASLSELLRSLSGTQSQMEASASAHSTRLEAQVNRLEQDLNNAVERASKADEEVRLSSLRSRVGAREAQIRIERLQSDLATTQKNLAVATSTIDSLRTRESELQEMLSLARATITQLERNTSTQPAVEPYVAPTTVPAPGTALYDAQLADLRTSLASAQAQAETARAQVAQYQSIAQTTEQTLQGLQKTYDEYRSGTESVLTDKQRRIEQLTEQLATARSDLAGAQATATQATETLASAQAQFDLEKRELEDTLAQLNDVETCAAGEQLKVQADVEAQLEEARAAHSKYETELLLHAEDLQVLNEAKTALAEAEHGSRQLQAKLDELQVAVDTEKRTAATARASGEQERTHLAKRIDDLTEQNVVLHNSLQSLTAHAPAFVAPNIGNTSSDTTTAAAPTDASTSGTVVEDFATVIKYLRREKEVADLQLDLSKQEVTRLRASLEAETANAEELRAQLAEERTKSVSNVSGTGKTSLQAELLARTNELAIVRESNTALREESERLGRKVHQLSTQLSTAQIELEPLQEQSRLAAVELEAAQASLRLVQEDNARWQARAQSILQQYNQVDPEELRQALSRASKAETDLVSAKAQLDQAQADRDAAVQAERTQLEQGKADALNAKDTELADRDKKFEQLRRQTIERLRARDAQIAGMRTEIEELKTVKDKATNEANQASEQVKVQLDTATKELEAAKAQVAQLTKDKETITTSLHEAQAKVASLEEQLATLNATSSDQAAAAEQQKKWEEEKVSLNSTITELKTQAIELESQLEQAKARTDSAASASDELTKLKEEHAAELAKLNEQRDAAIEQGVSDKLATLGAGSTGEEGSVEEGGQQTAVATLQARITDLEAQVKTAHEAAQTAQVAQEKDEQESSTAKAQTAEVEAKLKTLKTELAEAKQTIQQSGQQHTSSIQAAVRKSNEVASTAIKARDAEIENLKKQLEEVRAAQPSAASTTDATPDPDKVEAEVQARLAQMQSPEAKDQEAAIKTAVEAKEAELQAAHKTQLEAKFAAGRKEAELKTKLQILSKDKEIEKLRRELKEASSGTKDEGSSAAGAPANSNAGKPGTVAAAAGGGRVSGVTRGATPVGLRGRGARAAAASGRGGSTAGGKRKASDETTPSNGDGSKKPRGGGPIQVNRPTIRRPGQQQNNSGQS